MFFPPLYIYTGDLFTLINFGFVVPLVYLYMFDNKFSLFQSSFFLQILVSLTPNRFPTNSYQEKTRSLSFSIFQNLINPIFFLNFSIIISLIFSLDSTLLTMSSQLKCEKKNRERERERFNQVLEYKMNKKNSTISKDNRMKNEKKFHAEQGKIDVNKESISLLKWLIEYNKV